MNEFDLFHLVHIQNDQQYIQTSSIHQTTMHTLFRSLTNNIIMKKNQHNSNKNRIVKLLNYSAKSYTDIKHGLTKSSTTTTSSKKNLLCTAIFNKFIQELENQFTFSNYVSDVLTSNTFSAVTIINISKTDKTNFDIIGGALYACNPIYGVVIPLLFIDSNYQGQNIGSTLLEVLQKLTWTILLSTCIFVWFTNNENSEVLSFYRKLMFHPAHSSCYLFEHAFPSTIINVIDDLDSL